MPPPRSAQMEAQIAASSIPLATVSPSDILGVSYNGDATCAAVATQHGYMIFNLDPVMLIGRRDIGGVKKVMMLGRSNILALLGGGKHPFAPPNKVVLFDDKEGKTIAEIEFKHPVLSVAFRRDRLVVVVRNMVYVYSMPDLKELKRYDTNDNPSGLVALSAETMDGYCAMVGNQSGYVHVVDLDDKAGTPPLIFPAHKHPLSALALSTSGRLLATTSTSGSIVRVWRIAQRHSKASQRYELLHVFRRGYTSACIHSISFSKDGSSLLVNSDKTIHVFPLTRREVVGTATMTLNTMADMVPMLEPLQPTRSDIKFHTPTVSLCVFGNDSVVAITLDGQFYQFDLRDPDRVKFLRLIKQATEDIFQ